MCHFCYFCYLENGPPSRADLPPNSGEMPGIPAGKTVFDTLRRGESS